MRLQRGAISWATVLALLGAGIIDRLIKMLIEQPYFSAHSIGWRYFAFEQFHNTGVAFGIPLPPWFVLPLTFIFIVALLSWAWRARASRFVVLGAGLVAVGALSNAVDRVMYGYTIDYLRVINAILNLADVWVVVGIYMLLFWNKKTQH